MHIKCKDSIGFGLKAQCEHALSNVKQPLWCVVQRCTHAPEHSAGGCSSKLHFLSILQFYHSQPRPIPLHFAAIHTSSKFREVLQGHSGRGSSGCGSCSDGRA